MKRSFKPSLSIELLGVTRPENGMNASKTQAITEALQWYERMALEMQRATLRNDSKRMLELMRELSLDGGSKARRAAE